MDAPARYQIAHRALDGAHALHPAQPGERGRDHHHAKMAFAARIVPGVPGMRRAFVDHLDPLGGKRRDDAPVYLVADRSQLRLPHAPRPRYIGQTMASAPSPRRERLAGRCPAPDDRGCEAGGCDRPGEFKAPRDNRGGAGKDWRWLCLDHVRAFNTAYNYFDGMSPDAISAAQSPNPSWDRATRAFASNGYADRLRFDDNLEMIRLRFGARAFEEARARNGRPIAPADHKALTELDLDGRATHADIRRRYAELVRRFHPDRNGGDRAHEARLRRVIDAYTHLRTSAAFAATA